MAEEDAIELEGTNASNKNRATESDFIVSFVNKNEKLHRYPHLRHEKDRRFWFNIGKVPQDEEIVSAELRIYRNLTRRVANKGVKSLLSLYFVSEDETPETNMLELVDEISLSNHESGWVALNVSEPLINWIVYQKKNLGLYLKIRDANSSHNIDPHQVGLVCSKGAEQYQPFMVAYFRSGSRRRVRRAAKKKHDESYYDPDAYNPYSAYNGRDRYSKRNCQRWTLYVSFRDLGWEDWIIAPDGYAAFYCQGECSFPLNAHMNATNHAIVQTLVHLMDPSVVPKPCCAPTQLSPITVLYFDDNSNVILKNYKNMVVKSCGCH